jgi:hypothetical protein
MLNKQQANLQAVSATAAPQEQHKQCNSIAVLCTSQLHKCSASHGTTTCTVVCNCCCALHYSPADATSQLRHAIMLHVLQSADTRCCWRSSACRCHLKGLATMHFDRCKCSWCCRAVGIQLRKQSSRHLCMRRYTDTAFGGNIMPVCCNSQPK